MKQINHPLFLTLAITVLAACQLFGQAVVKFSFKEESTAAMALDSVSMLQYPIANHFGRPERIEGVIGNALRLDGYSTWITVLPFDASGISQQMSIQAWYATESFNYQPASIVSQQTSTAGFSLSVARYGDIVLEFYADSIHYQFTTQQSMSKYAWHYIAVTIDLEAAAAKIYVDGQLWLNENIEPQATFNLAANQALFVGRHAIYAAQGGFPIMVLNGALDEVVVRDDILSASEILAHYQQYGNVIPDLAIDPDIRHAGDHLRPQYHPMPNTSWTNEPYGLTWYAEKYHLFFQKNPNAPQLFFMHWGHLSSPDLVNWTEEKMALAPSPGFDSFGIWSGTTIKNDAGVPQIIYTGVNGEKAGIGGASPLTDSLIDWNRYPENPLVPNPPPGYNHMDFRDPFVWKSDSLYYMIVGSGLQNNGGGILFTWRSTDLVNWAPIEPLYRSSNIALTGKFWEMPLFFPLNDTIYLLAVTPVPTPVKRAETIYWLGRWDDETFTPLQVQPSPWELIQENFLSPAIGRDEQERVAYIGIIPEQRPEAPQVEAGWRHTFGLPRVVRQLNDSLIGHYPHPNLCRLRQQATTIQNRLIEKNTTFNLPEFASTQAELEFQLVTSDTSLFQIHFFKNEDEQEVTILSFDMINDRISLDRRQSTLGSGTQNLRTESYVYNPNDTILLRVFLDHSVLEVFIDNLVVFSARVYPSRASSNLIDATVQQGNLEIINLQAWPLSSIGDTMGNEVCAPEFLPPAMFIDTVHPNSSAIPELRGQGTLKLFPNPARRLIHIQLAKPVVGSVSLLIYSLSGEDVFKKKYHLNGDEILLTCPLPKLNDGVYLVSLRQENQQSTARLVVAN
ncbi:MAG: T9SS type A sorting domain-containing protein [Clostridia bacterium]|nr:T9SS type A sorting domain-containing protein [Clostridia bacterium]